MGKHSEAVNNSAHKTMEKQKKGIDIISQLPDELLIKILSLLPAADVTRSRILSNRWKHLWAFLPNLHIVIPHSKGRANKLNDSVDQILALRLTFQKFLLQCSHGNDANHVKNWLRIVTQCKVEEFEFRSAVLLKPEVEILFPCLKKMNLQCMEFVDENLLMDLISRCPVLEELCLDKLRLTCKSHMVKISSLSMRRLTIKESDFKNQELVIDIPKLEYLHLKSCYFRSYTLVNPASLVEAKISDSSNYLIQLLRFVSSTKIMTLTRKSLLALGGIQNINLPMFPNLVKLEIVGEWNPLLNLLNNMPNLECLSFPNGLLSYISEWNPPNEDQAPPCVRFKLKEIFIVPNLTLQERAVLSYLLKHANILEKLTVGEDYSFNHEQWFNMQCISKSCRIEFV
ncbi:putative F-box/FBD/LRR-repeat protein At1g16940 [Rutidosis leptorrhynchoides]|uniref:putative F-box/FBD/LRR-repeat protein At1g16940 n=1 Tax=Rutidosis leptorrhynchoides TaxID=125765 RepID=UPI003A9A02B0